MLEENLNIKLFLIKSFFLENFIEIFFEIATKKMEILFLKIVFGEKDSSFFLRFFIKNGIFSDRHEQQFFDFAYFF